MKTMAAGEFKTHCLSVIDDVHDNGEEFVITKRGRPLAKLVPFEPKEPESIFGFLKGQVEIVGDIVSPIVSPEEWDEDLFPPGSPERRRLKGRSKAAGKTRAGR